MKLISSFSERFKKALEIRNIKPSKFSEMVDINKSTISQYLSGEYEPKRNRIDLFAKKLEVDEAWLIGYDVPMERRTTKPAVKEDFNIEHISTNFVAVPLYNSISAGYGSEEADFIEMMPIPDLRNPQECFAVRVKGDSMEDRIMEDSIILIRKNCMIENGEIGAFLYNEKSIVKQKKIYGQTIVLHSINNKYDDITIDDNDEFKEYGKVIMVIERL